MAKRRRLQPPLRRHHPQQPRPRPRPAKGDAAASRPTVPAKQAQKRRRRQQQQQAPPPTIPFAPPDRILLVGEGDLSFAASIVRHHGCGNVTATVLEKDRAELLAKYPAAASNIAVFLEPGGQGGGDSHGGGGGSDDDDDNDDDDNNNNNKDDGDDSDIATRSSSSQPPPSLPPNNRLLFNIDATKLPPALVRPPRFDRVVFNFPHVGGKSTDINRQVRHNQSLLVAFFERAVPALAPRGAIIVTLFDGEPYSLWNIRDLARHAGLAVERSFAFHPAAYPGYRHARTCGVVRGRDGRPGAGWRGEDRPARSYVFKRKGEVDVQPLGGKKRGRGHRDSSDDDDDDD